MMMPQQARASSHEIKPQSNTHTVLLLKLSRLLWESVGSILFRGHGDIARLKLGPLSAAWNTSIWRRPIETEQSLSVSNIHPYGPAWCTLTGQQGIVWAKRGWMLEPLLQPWEKLLMNQRTLWLLRRCHPMPSFNLILCNIVSWFSANTGLRNDKPLTRRLGPLAVAGAVMLLFIVSFLQPFLPSPSLYNLVAEKA